MARVTNLVMNGRGKYTSGTMEVRRNLVTQPRSTEGRAVMGISGGPSSGWGGTAAHLSVIADHTAPSGGGFITRLTHDSAGTTSNGGDLGYGVGVRIALNTPYTQSVFVRSSAPLVVRPMAQILTSTSTSAGAFVGQTLQLTPGEWTRLSLTASVSAETAYAWRLDTDSAAAVAYPAGTTLDFDAAMVEQSSELRPYFDGSYSPDADLTPSWTGTENASASVLSGAMASSFVGSNSFRIASTQWPVDGTSVRVIPSGNSNGSYVQQVLSASIYRGKYLAIRARGYLPSPLTGSLAGNAYVTATLWYRTDSYHSTKGSNSGNVSGEFDSQAVTFVPEDATEVFFRLYNGSGVFGESVYFTDVISCVADTEAEALAAVQTYFDGDSKPFRISSGNQLVIPKWSGTPGSSSSYYDWTEPYTLAAKWDDVGQRTYELGCDRGVFYPPDGDGVLWNGLTAVNFSTENGDSTSYYHDGVKYFTNFPVGEFKGHLEAFTYPDEFMLYDGFSSPVDGMYLDEQQRKPFGLTYRTRVGDDQYGDSSFYRIHILYNVYAVPSEKAYATISESPTASTFSWDLKTLQIAPGISGSYYSNTSHIVVDTRKFELSKIKALEEILYGDGADPGRLPLPSEVYSILNS